MCGVCQDEILKYQTLDKKSESGSVVLNRPKSLNNIY